MNERLNERAALANTIALLWNSVQAAKSRSGVLSYDTMVTLLSQIQREMLTAHIPLQFITPEMTISQKTTTTDYYIINSQIQGARILAEDLQLTNVKHILDLMEAQNMSIFKLATSKLQSHFQEMLSRLDRLDYIIQKL